MLMNAATRCLINAELWKKQQSVAQRFYGGATHLVSRKHKCFFEKIYFLYQKSLPE